jgi:glycosyltransferase involved in cell wall biosynthesis
VSRRSLARSIFSIAPTLARRNDTLQHLELKGKFDLVLAESEQVAGIFNNPAVSNAAHVLRMHNEESSYMLSLAKSEARAWKRVFFGLEALRFRWFSPKVMRQADMIWAISAKEYDGLRRTRGELKEKVRWLPTTLPRASCALGRSPKQGRVLFVANLSGPINQHAIAWYLDFVHPRLLGLPGYDLVVAGSTAARGRTGPGRLIIDRIVGTEKCTLIANPPSLAEIYRDSAVFINPMRHGAGVKLKTVHAAAAGVPIVTTEIGNEGTGLVPGEHLMIAGTDIEFAAAVESMLDDPPTAEEMARKALNFVSQFYQPEALNELIREVAGK